MLSQTIQLNAIRKEDVDKEVLRAAIMAELDAVNLYEQLAGFAQDKDIIKILMDVAREEKTHIGEFQALLLKIDAEQAEELQKGRREVVEKTGRAA